MRLIEDASEVPGDSVSSSKSKSTVIKTKLMLLFFYCQLRACDVQNIKCNIHIGVLFFFIYIYNYTLIKKNRLVYCFSPGRQHIEVACSQLWDQCRDIKHY